MHGLVLDEENTEGSTCFGNIPAQSKLTKLETLNAQARDLEQTIARNVPEILET